MVVGEIANVTEVLVIGGGPGGYHAAERAARAGKEVTLIESGPLGGVCLNTGCIPSKALIQGGRSGAAPYRAAAAIDFPALQVWKTSVVERLSRGVQQILKRADVAVVKGFATFTGSDKVSVATEHGNETYRFQHCIIATGSRPLVIPGFEPDGGLILDSTAALDLPTVPRELLVLGGGYIGLELGTAYAKLGSRVTVVEALDRVLPVMDPDLSNAVERRLKELGVAVHIGTRALAWSRSGEKAAVSLNGPKGAFTAEADRVLIAVGRRPNTDKIDLAVAGVRTDEKGFIITDQQCRTSVPCIYAIGDVITGPMLAHKATRDAEVAADAILGRPAAIDSIAMPAIVFSDPEVASVGLTEAEARAAGYTPVTGRAQLAASGRAWILGEAAGFVKVVADRASGLLLGVQIAGPEASELIAAPALALELGARVYDIAKTVHPHPTLSESVREAAFRALEASLPVPGL